MSLVDSLSSGVMGMILHAGPVAKAVLLVLLFFSIFSWAIILSKLIHFGKVEREGRNILNLVSNKEGLKKFLSRIRFQEESPYGRIAIAFFRNQEDSTREDHKDARRDQVSLETIMDLALKEETEKLEKYLSFLATTANTAPFVGLFGTVWGIMDSFREIGLRGSTSLQVVAPGISEALIATAFGLATAIPAVVAYNYLLGRLRRIVSSLESFANVLSGLSTK